MSKLSEFYNIKAQVFDNNDDSSRWDAVEEKLIREELLPELIELLKPVLAQVKSPLSLNVSYDPNGNIALSMTRNCIQAIQPASLVETETNIESVPQEEVSAIVSEPSPIESPVEETNTNDVPMDEPEEILEDENTEKQKISRSKSVGFIVRFDDGTEINEKKGKNTFVKALQHIGLARIANDDHGVSHAGFNVVDTRKRESETKKQELVEGYYVYTHMSHGDKIDDLKALAAYYNIGISIKNVDEEEYDVLDGTPPILVASIPSAAEEDTKELSIKEQFRNYLLKDVKENTANSYVTVLEKHVINFIHEDVDANIESIFSYIDPEEVELCIEMLKNSEAFIEENKRKHNSMTAALNLYQSFVNSLQ